MTSLPEQKAALRKTTLAVRDSLAADRRIEMSLDAMEHGLHAISFDPGTVVAGFHPIRSEIDPRPLMFELAKRGARLCLPVVTNSTTIEFRDLVRGAPLVESGFGTVGPDETAAVLDPQILLVPLSVFDRTGARIGYGAGYYDRAIERLRQKDIDPLLIGMAFSVQEAQTVPVEPHDVLLNGVLTEQRYRAIAL